MLSKNCSNVIANTPLPTSAHWAYSDTGVVKLINLVESSVPTNPSYSNLITGASPYVIASAVT